MDYARNKTAVEAIGRVTIMPSMFQVNSFKLYKMINLNI
jgi:hypothetical protein